MQGHYQKISDSEQDFALIFLEYVIKQEFHFGFDGDSLN
jgi:hypothetical protein